MRGDRAKVGYAKDKVIKPTFGGPVGFPKALSKEEWEKKMHTVLRKISSGRNHIGTAVKFYTEYLAGSRQQDPIVCVLPL